MPTAAPSKSPAALKPCPEGKVRNPTTGRCRKAVSAATTEVPAIKSAIKASTKPVTKSSVHPKGGNKQMRARVASICNYLVTYIGFQNKEKKENVRAVMQQLLADVTTSPKRFKNFLVSYGPNGEITMREDPQNLKTVLESLLAYNPNLRSVKDIWEHCGTYGSADICLHR